MKCKVVKPCMIAYGSTNKAWIYLNRRQIWELRAFPSKRFDWYSLSRHSMTIDVVKEDFDRIFDPQESEEQG
jgi:hypothetical protein